MQPTAVELGATILFALAILHTFLVSQFQRLAHRFPDGSVGENFFHLLGEVEVVFGIWAAFFLMYFGLMADFGSALKYLESRNFTEPAFVFVILVVSSTKPVLRLAEIIIEFFSKLIPIRPQISFYIVALILGPILGSVITEPAAMTVTALLLVDRYYSKGISRPFMYATLGLLFVNVSIGGTLTSYAAPPVLMVAGPWGWDSSFMLTHFGWKGALACVISTLFVTFRFAREMAKIEWEKPSKKASGKIPLWVYFTHLLALGAIVAAAHHPVVSWGVFLFFLGLVTVTEEYQKPLKLREGLLVGFFLGGLVVLGGQQRWWLEPVLTNLSSFTLYIGAMGLTAITDNAALTYLGTQVPSLSEASKYALVAGAVVGGGLTVIANAPNPAGFGILNKSFGDGGISPLGLLLSALPPTIIAAILYWIF